MSMENCGRIYDLTPCPAMKKPRLASRLFCARFQRQIGCMETKSGHQQHLAGRLPPLQIAVGLGSVAELVLVPDV